MTLEQADLLISEGKIRRQLVGLMIRQFPTDVPEAEDRAHRALLRTRKAHEAFYDATGFEGYAKESAIGIALDDRTKAIERRKTLQGIPKHKSKADPARHIDYKIDLERAIKAVTGSTILQKALWHIRYEEWTWQEVLEAMPKDRHSRTYERHLTTALQELRVEMRRKEYYGKQA